MALVHGGPHGHRAHETAAAIRQAFWVLALGAIALYAFLVALGAFAPADVRPVTVVVVVLTALWVVHAWLQRRAADARDPGVRGARERRGF